MHCAPLLALLALFAPLGAGAVEANVDWAAARATCRVQVPADPTRTSLAGARLAAERVAREQLKLCLAKVVGALSVDGRQPVERAAAEGGGAAKVSAAVGRFEVLHAAYASDGSVGLEAAVELGPVAALLVPGTGTGAVQLAVDVRGLGVGRSLTVRVLDPDGRPVYAGLATYGAAAAGVLEVKASGTAKGTVSDVTVPADGARAIREAHLAQGGVRLLVDR